MLRLEVQDYRTSLCNANAHSVISWDALNRDNINEFMAYITERSVEQLNRADKLEEERISNNE